MKLRKGKPRYPMPPHSQIIGVYLEGHQRHNQMAAFPLYQVPIEEVRAMQREGTWILGCPIGFSIHDNGIEFCPAPDSAYVVRVRYTPPVMEC